jgi:hypothetical protein
MLIVPRCAMIILLILTSEDAVYITDTNTFDVSMSIIVGSIVIVVPLRMFKF